MCNLTRKAVTKVGVLDGKLGDAVTGPSRLVEDDTEVFDLIMKSKQLGWSVLPCSQTLASQSY
jgi:hypothetical protein